MAHNIDDLIDSFLNTIFNFMFIRVPLFLLPHILTIYANILLITNKCVKQLKQIWAGVLNSFDDKFIGFYEFLDNSNTKYIPIIISSKNVYNIHSKWLYDLNKKVFTLCEIHHDSTTHHIPFIGASLEVFDDDNSKELIGDMSEWLMDQTIFGPNNVIPLQILATAWLYSTSEKLYVSYKNMRMRIVNEDGDEKVYDLQSECEIINDKD